MIVMILMENRFERKSKLHGLSKALLFPNAAQKRRICRCYSQEVDDELHAKLRPVDLELLFQKLHCASECDVSVSKLLGFETFPFF